MPKSFDELAGAVLQELATTLRAVDEGQVAAFRRTITGAARIFVAGKGRSGLHARAFAMRLMQLGLQVHVVDEATTPPIGASDLLIVASGSGRTASLVQYSERARSLGAKIALVTIAPDSSIAANADAIVCLPAPSPKLDQPNSIYSIQPLGSLFEQALGIFFDLVILQLMEERGMTSPQMFERHANLE